MNPTIGSGMQQARDSQDLRVSSAPQERAAEKTGEVVRNHEVGTGLLAWYARGRRCDGDITPGVDAGELVDEGEHGSDDIRIGQRCPDQVPDWTNPMRGRSESDRGESAKL